jgi:hypothetical protein
MGVIYSDLLKIYAPDIKNAQVSVTVTFLQVLIEKIRDMAGVMPFRRSAESWLKLHPQACLTRLYIVWLPG